MVGAPALGASRELASFKRGNGHEGKVTSDVHAKWKNSRREVREGSAVEKVSLRKYSTALTSWLVVRSISLIRSACFTLNVLTSSSSVARVVASKGGS